MVDKERYQWGHKLQHMHALYIHFGYKYGDCEDSDQPSKHRPRKTNLNPNQCELYVTYKEDKHTNLFLFIKLFSLGKRKR